MTIKRREILKTIVLTPAVGLPGCVSEPYDTTDTNSMLLQIEYDDCWTGTLSLHTADRKQIILKIDADMRQEDDSYDIGNWHKGVWELPIPGPEGMKSELVPPIVANITIRDFTECEGGTHRDWSQKQLRLTLLFNGNVVDTDTATGLDSEAQVRYE